MNADYAESLLFLEWWRPSGPWVPVAIEERQTPEARTFTADEKPEFLEWAESRGRKSNIYFTVNPLMAPISKKPRREDVMELAWLHVDIDPRANEDLEEEQTRILSRLTDNLPDGVPPPSCIIFSGGGYQAFWRLETPIPINGERTLYEDAARYNIQLETLFQADSCHNIDRIMRLPGTLNRPDAKKRKKGRTLVKAYVHERNDVAYSTKTFTKAPMIQGAALAGTVHVSGNVRRVQDVNELPDKVPLKCKEIIAQGTDPEDPNRWGGDRSRALWYVVCELKRAEVDDEMVYAIITDPDWAISAHVLAQGSRWHKCAIHQIEQAKDKAIDPMLQFMNEKYAVITNVQGKCRVLTETEELVGKRLRSRVHYMSFDDIRNAYCNRTVEVGKDPKTRQPITMKVGIWWLNHERRRQYDTVVFAPEQNPPDAYNLWRGFAYDAIGTVDKCQLFLDHVFKVICSGDQGHYDYLIRWMANAIQNPNEPGHVAVVMRGGQGTGKGSFANHFGALWGRHYMSVTNAEHLFGRFNAHLMDCCVLFADEAFWAGNKKHEGQLKALVTEDMIVTERKNFDAQAMANYLHILMASNSDWVVPTEVDDRRFFVLDVSESQKQDQAYFLRLNRSMESGGYEALLHFLLSMDLSDFQPRRAPQTEALRQQKIHSFTIEQEWWYSKLMAGIVLPHRPDWPESHVFAEELTADFTSYCKTWGNSARSNQSKLAHFLGKVLPKGTSNTQLSGQHELVMPDGDRKVVSRPRAYDMRGQSLESCRAHWDAKFGGPYKWPMLYSQNDDTPPPPPEVF